MTQYISEITWICQILIKVGFEASTTAKLWYDNQVAFHITFNLMFHEIIKYIEIDCHFICEKIQQKLVCTRHVEIREQLQNIFTKALSLHRVDYIYNKLDIINIYALA